MPELPIIDVGALVQGSGEAHEAAWEIGRACREHGFFYVTNHGVDDALQERLDTLSRHFFALPLEEKQQIRMALGGRAWRGFFPVGGELTSGKPDLKEGLYFGSELPRTDPRVIAKLPLHGENLFPPSMPELRAVVLDYLRAMTTLGHALMSGLAQSLGLDAAYFREQLTADPITLFRIFHYPPATDEVGWGVGEHTDYGVLTILKQDEVRGLEVSSHGQWIAAPPVHGAFVCNIGDMLERMTGGRYVSTPHRVRNSSGRSRLSYPFFFDPGWDARVQALPLSGEALARPPSPRWDGASVHTFEGTYGEYLLGKVAKVFPQLRDEVL